MWRLDRISRTVFGVALVLALLGFARVASATQYDVVVPVADDSVEARQAAARAALTALLPKLTGLRDPAAKPQVSSILASIDRWIQEFGYQRGRDQDGLRVRLVFDGMELGRALNKAGVTTWGARAPSVLALARVVEANGAAHIVSADEVNPWRDALVASAAQRGVVLVFPLLDLEDQGALGDAVFADPANKSTDVLARRYGADAVWIGVLSAGAAGSQGRWHITSGTSRDVWESRGPDIANTIQTGMDGAVDRLITLYKNRSALLTAGSRRVMVWVRSVQSMADYWSVLDELRATTGITDVRVEALRDDQVGFSARTAATPDVVLSLLTGRGAFDPDTATAGVGSPSDVLLRMRP